jgi:hypothetical protein
MSGFPTLKPAYVLKVFSRTYTGGGCTDYYSLMSGKATPWVSCLNRFS